MGASGTHIEAFLQQLESCNNRPLAFFSTFNRELTAIFAAVRHYCFLLEGQDFRILTDHKPLTSAYKWVLPPWSARQQRQLAYIAEFSVDIIHTTGAHNWVADALSRPTAIAAAPSLSSSSPIVDPPQPAPIFPSSPSVGDWQAASEVHLSPIAAEEVMPPQSEARLDMAVFALPSGLSQTCSPCGSLPAWIFCIDCAVNFICMVMYLQAESGRHSDTVGQRVFVLLAGKNLSPRRSLCPATVSRTSTWTLWGRCHFLAVSHIFSQWCTGTPAGWRPSH
jgi:RNase H-like domain found in reverse transcriptase